MLPYGNKDLKSQFTSDVAKKNKKINILHLDTKFQISELVK